MYRYVQNDPVNLMDPVGLAVPLVLAAPAAAKSVAAGGVALFKALKVTFFLCSAALAAAGIIKVQENTEEKPEVDEKCSGTSTGDDGDDKNKGNRKKPGKRGEFKGRDALRQENKMARDAAKKAGLNRGQQRQLHDSITGQDLKFQDILEIAKEIKKGIF